MNKESHSSKNSHPACTCCVLPNDQALHRRRFLTLAGTLAAGALMPRPSWAEDICQTRERYDALVLSCIDPRMPKPVYKYLKKRDLICKTSQITLAGAAIGVVAPRFESWQPTFWENLRISVTLHKIPRIIVINHRRCGAATEAYGPFEYDSEAETRLHRAVASDFRAEVRRHHPLLDVETWLMGLDGKIEELQ